MRFQKNIPISFKTGGYIFSSIAIIFFIISVIISINTYKFLKSSIIIDGEIIDIYTSESRDSDGSTSVSIYPIIKFYDKNKNEIIWKANTTSDDAIIIGEKIKIRHNPENPKNARIDTWSGIWFGTLITSVFFVFFTFFGIIFLKIK